MIDLMKSVKEMNEKTKRCVYILFESGKMSATTNKTDIDNYLKSDECLISPYTDMDDVSMIYGFQMDVEELPYELSEKALKDRYLWLVIGNSMESLCERYNDVREVTEAIADFLKRNPDMDISDFAVLLGIEVELVMSVSSAGTYIQEFVVYD